MNKLYLRRLALGSLLFFLALSALFTLYRTELEPLCRSLLVMSGDITVPAQNNK